MAESSIARIASPPPVAIGSPQSVVSVWLAGRTPSTLAAYRQSIEDFAAWLGCGADDAARRLLGSGPGPANELALRYRNAMTDRGMKSSTVSVRLSALRSLVKVARMVGAVNWSLDVPLPKVKAYRDTRGPGAESVAGMVEAVGERTDAKGKRDVAILRLLFDVALRRSEVVGMDMEHFDAERRRIAVKGKGDTGRDWITLPEPTAEALREWIAERGNDPGPLFVELATGKRGRLSGTSVATIVTKAGDSVGVRARPHGLRHSAITAALDATGGNVRTVAKFSRHAKIETVCRYDDARTDAAGIVAKAVALPRKGNRHAEN